MYLPTLKLNVTAKVQVTPGSPFQSICLDLVDLSCDMESTMFDKRSVYPKRKGIPNRIASVKFSSDEFWNARHFCNDAYVEGELDVIASKFDFEALRDSLWAAKDVLLHKKESVSLNANLRCFVTSDVYLFGIFLRRHTNEKPIEQSTVLATSAAENSHEENDDQETLVANPKTIFGSSLLPNYISPFGNLSFHEADFGVIIDMANVSKHLSLDLPSSLEEFRINYPGTNLVLGRGVEATSNWWVEYYEACGFILGTTLTPLSF